MSKEKAQHIHCIHVVKSPVTLILGKASCMGMNLIKILDSDPIHCARHKIYFLYKVFTRPQKVYYTVYVSGTLPGQFFLLSGCVIIRLRLSEMSLILLRFTPFVL